VIAGTTDTAAEVLGAGAVRPGSGIIKLASVGRIAIVAPEPIPTPHILNYRHVLDGLWYPGTASKYAASSYRWLRDLLGFDNSKTTIYAEMDTAAAFVPAGSDGLIFHPHLNGEWAPYWDDRMRGDFIGLTTRHTRAHIIRSVLEGVAFGLKDALGAMENSGLRANELRLIGNGSRSLLWPSIVANVLNRPLRRPVQSDAAYGAALIVAMGVGAIEARPDALESTIQLRDSIQPQPETTARYETLFNIYRDSDQALRSISARLYDFERN
jgi:xylulokinase